MKRYNSVPQIRCLHFLPNLKHRDFISIASNPTEMQVNYELSRAKEEVGVRQGWGEGSHLVPDMIGLFPVMWKNGAGIKHKGKVVKEWKRKCAK